MVEVNGFEGVVDLIQMKALVWESDEPTNYVVKDIPADLQDKAKEYHDKLVEAVAETAGIYSFGTAPPFISFTNS